MVSSSVRSRLGGGAFDRKANWNPCVPSSTRPVLTVQAGSRLCAGPGGAGTLWERDSLVCPTAARS